VSGYLLQDLEFLIGIPLHLLDGKELPINLPSVNGSLDQGLPIKTMGGLHQFLNRKNPILVQTIRYICHQFHIQTTFLPLFPSRIHHLPPSILLLILHSQPLLHRKLSPHPHPTHQHQQQPHQPQPNPQPSNSPRPIPPTPTLTPVPTRRRSWSHRRLRQRRKLLHRDENGVIIIECLVVDVNYSLFLNPKS